MEPGLPYRSIHYRIAILPGGAREQTLSGGRGELLRDDRGVLGLVPERGLVPHARQPRGLDLPERRQQRARRAPAVLVVHPPRRRLGRSLLRGLRPLIVCGSRPDGCCLKTTRSRSPPKPLSQPLWTTANTPNTCLAYAGWSGSPREHIGRPPIDHDALHAQSTGNILNYFRI